MSFQIYSKVQKVHKKEKLAMSHLFYKRGIYAINVNCFQNVQLILPSIVSTFFYALFFLFFPPPFPSYNIMLIGRLISHKTNHVIALNLAVIIKGHEDCRVSTKIFVNNGKRWSHSQICLEDITRQSCQCIDCATISFFPSLLYS